LARTENDRLAVNGTQAHAYYHADGNGNVTMLLDTNQAVGAQYVYGPFGDTLAATGPIADANLSRFSSKEAHIPSGLSYYLYRFYDPQPQRWLNRDPIREIGFESLRAQRPKRGGGTRSDRDSLFLFAGNSPISRMDYLGLDSPGCDPPATSLPCILPGPAECYLDCCRDHDVCFHGHHCSAATAWMQILIPCSKCGGCNRDVLACFAQCLLGGSPPGGAPYYCAALDTFYYSWDDMPPLCWDTGVKPPKPSCYP